MYKIKLSPYSKTFYYEWVLNPLSSNYNMVADQILKGKLDINRLRSAIKRFLSEHLLFNSHIKSVNDELFWVKNDNIYGLKYRAAECSTQSLFEYVSNQIDKPYIILGWSLGGR